MQSDTADGGGARNVRCVRPRVGHSVGWLDAPICVRAGQPPHPCSTLPHPTLPSRERRLDARGPGRAGPAAYAPACSAGHGSGVGRQCSSSLPTLLPPRTGWAHAWAQAVPRPPTPSAPSRPLCARACRPPARLARQMTAAGRSAGGVKARLCPSVRFRWVVRHATCSALCAIQRAAHHTEQKARHSRRTDSDGICWRA